MNIRMNKAKWLFLAASLTLAGFAVLWFGFPAKLYGVSVTLERSLAGVETGQVSVGELDWHYWQGGSGETLVLVHGFGGDKDNWVRIAPYLVDHYTLVAPDLIGFGESSQPQDLAYDISAQADRLLAFLDAMGIERFHIGGNSMGGYIAGALAARAPERVLSLWLLDPGGVMGAEMSEAMKQVFAGGPNPLILKEQADMGKLLDLVFTRRPFIPAPVVKFLGQKAVAHQALATQIFSDLRYRSPALEEYLGSYTGVTLITWGEQDRVLHPSGAAVLEKLIPDSRVILVPQTGHMPMVERPAVTAQGYLDFMAGQSTVPALPGGN
jgi:abhydrolase domain-containing protein 6